MHRRALAVTRAKSLPEPVAIGGKMRNQRGCGIVKALLETQKIKRRMP
jgi:hypothetical protein